VLSALREETIQVRGYKEIQQLVHDLRRPLTTMLGLADVLAEILPPGAEREYANRLIQQAWI
jgi:His Kinase A (phosphoacceptor) domain.